MKTFIMTLMVAVLLVSSMKQTVLTQPLRTFAKKGGTILLCEKSEKMRDASPVPLPFPGTREYTDGM